MKQYRLEAEAAVEIDVEVPSSGTKLRNRGLDSSFWNSFVLLIAEFSKIRLDIKSCVPAFAAR